jgi:hypothetical protein
MVVVNKTHSGALFVDIAVPNSNNLSQMCNTQVQVAKYMRLILAIII